MGMTAFPVVSGAQVVAGGDSSAKHEPGTILAYRSVTDQWALAQYLQMANTGLSQGEVGVVNFATLKQYSVKPAATTDGGAPMAGIALATIASQKFGFLAIQGYVEKADLSHTAASGEYLCLSGSTAAKLTPDRASVVNAGTLNTSALVILAIARTAIATGVGSVTICGTWGV